MAIKSITLSRLKTHLEKTLNECAESGETVVIEMPDRRLLSIQPLEPQEDDTSQLFFESGGVSSGSRVSHRTLCRTVFAFHDDEEIGPRMLARIAKRTGLRPEDL